MTSTNQKWNWPAELIRVNLLFSNKHATWLMTLTDWEPMNGNNLSKEQTWKQAAELFWQLKKSVSPKLARGKEGHACLIKGTIPQDVALNAHPPDTMAPNLIIKTPLNRKGQTGPYIRWGISCPKFILDVRNQTENQQRKQVAKLYICILCSGPNHHLQHNASNRKKTHILLTSQGKLVKLTTFQVTNQELPSAKESK